MTLICDHNFQGELDERGELVCSSCKAPVGLSPDDIITMHFPEVPKTKFETFLEWLFVIAIFGLAFTWVFCSLAIEYNYCEWCERIM